YFHRHWGRSVLEWLGPIHWPREADATKHVFMLGMGRLPGVQLVPVGCWGRWVSFLVSALWQSLAMLTRSGFASGTCAFNWRVVPTAMMTSLISSANGNYCAASVYFGLPRSLSCFISTAPRCYR